MSTSSAVDIALPLEERPQAEYLGTILGEELWWDHGPWWADGDTPMHHTYLLDGTIRADELCDVDRLPDSVRVPKVMECGHGLVGGQVYVTWLDTQDRMCVPCAQAVRR